MASVGIQSEYKSELPIVVHQSIKAKIYDYYQNKKINYFLLALGLYVFFYDATRRQNNIRVWLTDSFIRKGTGIGQRILPTIKKDLTRMGLIEIHHPKKGSGVFGKRYIEVKFVWKPEAIDKLFYQESDETTEYKIARALLIGNFGYHEDIESQGYEFEAEVNGGDVTLFADIFYFNDDEVLIARAGFHGGEEDFDYTVPSDRVGDIVRELAAGYKFSFKGVLNALSGH